MAFFVSNIKKHGISFCEYGMIRLLMNSFLELTKKIEEARR